MKLLSFLFLITLSSAFAAGPISGVDGPFVNVQDGKLVVTLKMQEAIQPNGMTFSITEEKKSVVNFVPNTEDGGMTLELQLDLADLKSVETGDGESKLMDGRSIPGIPGGALKNSKRRDWPQEISTFHSPKSFGIAVPFNWNLGSTKDGHHWLNWKGKNIGMISVVNATQDKKAFGMVFIRFAAIKKHAELMEKINNSRK